MRRHWEELFDYDLEEGETSKWKKPSSVDANAPKTNVVSLTSRLPRPHALTWTACKACDVVFIAVIECDRRWGVDEDVDPFPDCLECPFCGVCDAVVREAWRAACLSVCETCDLKSVEVIFDQVDILPSVLPCKQCGKPTRFTPWPPADQQ